LDLEAHARHLFIIGKPKDEIINELSILSGSKAKAEAVLTEIVNTENITDSFIAEISGFHESGINADRSGLGCRGEGDFFIHHKIAELIENKNTLIGPDQQDDAGIVKLGSGYLAVAVDGMHSRLSHFPFIAGFHVARAAIRDIIVMGCSPKALFSDIHLANDGDVAKVFDYTAGISAVGELSDIPLIAGSTLRIGGDLVLGDRLTGCAGCIGHGMQLTPRKDAKPGDVLIMTEGSGGGTIATTALFNGLSEVVKQTLNLRMIGLGKELMNSELLTTIHSITDITNGGVRGDAFEISNTAHVKIVIYEDKFLNLVDPIVLAMLEKLGIDPLGVSIDSFLFILPPEHVEQLMKFISDLDYKVDIIGGVTTRQTDGPGESIGVSLIKNSALPDEQMEEIPLYPEFREAPYTPIKKVVNVKVKDQEALEQQLEVAKNRSLAKKEMVKNWIIQERLL
jgi:hydrogenase expression/formation protein